MNLWNHYHLAESVSDAVEVLSSAPGSARIIAGGSDLLLDMQLEPDTAVHTLVDVTRIPELNQLEIRQGQLFVGAAVPLRAIVASSLICSHAQALQEACSLIGGPQVRNTATLGGNVAHALPAADGTIALLAMNAIAEVAHRDTRELRPLEDLFLGPGKSALHPQNELLVGFHLPIDSEGTGSAFKRIMRPQGVAIAILNLGCWLKREGDRIGEIRISVGPGGPRPIRTRQTERYMLGKQPEKEVLESAWQVLLAETSFRTSRHRATEQYRHWMAGVLLEETLLTAWERTFDES